jgi:hypothetical protein
MCTPTGAGGTCTDLNDAKDGFRILLQTLDAKLDRIGLVDLPGVQTAASDPCGPIASVSGGSPYDDPRISYRADTLLNDFQNAADGSLNTGSLLYKHSTKGTSSACIRAGGGTSYSQALRTAIAELQNNGRANAQKIIIFMTDGAANVGPVYNCNSSALKSLGCASMSWNGPDNVQPCQTSINVANAAKTSQKIIFYTIGYDLNSQPQDSICERGIWGSTSSPLTQPSDISATANWTQGHIQGSGCYTNSKCKESPAITPTQTLKQIASDPTKYYPASQGDLVDVFAQIAADIESGTSRLVKLGG